MNWRYRLKGDALLTKLIFLIILLNRKTELKSGGWVVVVDIGLDCSVYSLEYEVPDMDNKLL